MNRLWFVLVGLLLYNAMLSWFFFEQRCFAHSSQEQSGGLWHRLVHGHEDLSATKNVTRPMHKNPACGMPATTIVRNSDRARELKYIEFWKQLTPGYIQSRKRVWQNAIALVPERPPAGLFEPGTRGIVSTAGNRDTIQRVLTLLKLLRYLNCTLPMEIWHFPGEISESWSAKFERWGAKTRDITDQSLPSPFPSHKYLQEKNYHIKAATIINSRFQEVLYLDSDNLPLRDPVSLFEAPDYIDTGALFWPDFWKTHPLNPIWEMMGVECRDEWEQEAGQIVVDKQRHWKPLHLAHHLNMKHEFYFQFINGDKDTFRFAWLALNATSAWPRRYLASLGFRFRDKFCGHTMVQADFPNRHEVEEAIRLEGNREGIDNDPPLRYMFAHANLIKDIPDSAFDGKPFTQLKRYVGEAGITFLKPTIYLTDEPGGIGGCVDLLSGQGEPATMVEDFEAQWFPNFNLLYKVLGGRGATPVFADKLGPPPNQLGMDKLLPKCMLCLNKERAEETKYLSQFADDEDDL